MIRDIFLTISVPMTTMVNFATSNIVSATPIVDFDFAHVDFGFANVDFGFANVGFDFTNVDFDLPNVDSGFGTGHSVIRYRIFASLNGIFSIANVDFGFTNVDFDLPNVDFGIAIVVIFKFHIWSNNLTDILAAAIRLKRI
ncbi:MAG: hypothetical protein WCH34_01490 [Bacteroidota bacterium]